MTIENANVETANIEVEEINLISILEGKQTIATLTEKLNEVINQVNTYKGMKPRDRGPKSERAMSEEDANRVILGDLKDVSHKEAASKLGLSYGQIYSARGGYTFKKIHKQIQNESK